MAFAAGRAASSRRCPLWQRPPTISRLGCQGPLSGIHPYSARPSCCPPNLSPRGVLGATITGCKDAFDERKLPPVPMSVAKPASIRFLQLFDHRISQSDSYRRDALSTCNYPEIFARPLQAHRKRRSNLAVTYIFFPHSFSLFPNKTHFFPRAPPLFPQLTTALTKPLTYPSTLGGIP